jgi:hypothetical protein
MLASFMTDDPDEEEFEPEPFVVIGARKQTVLS